MTIGTKIMSFKTIIASAAVALGLMAGAAPALASGGAAHPRSGGFSFEGPFGTYDQGQLQRGYKVYHEVCAACHSMNLMHYRNLGDAHGPFWNPKYPNPNDNPVVKALAKEVQVGDIDSETGEAIQRDATPADKFRAPYPNATAAAAGNGGAAPPDLSVMAKARHDGANYIYSLLSGYKAAPAGPDHPRRSALQSLYGRRPDAVLGRDEGPCAARRLHRHAAAAARTARSPMTTVRPRRWTSTPRTSPPSSPGRLSRRWWNANRPASAC